MNTTLIAVGHGAYHGANRLSYHHSKAAAINELRLRGVKRDDARAAVNQASAKPHGYATTRVASEHGPYIGDPIEVTNRQDLIEVRRRNDLLTQFRIAAGIAA